MSNVNQFSLCAGFLAVALGSAEAQVRLLTDPPDFAVEMRTGNLVGPLCGPDGYWRGKIADAIRSQVGATADVRFYCHGGSRQGIPTRSEEVVNVGIWRSPALPIAVTRDVALQVLDFLKTGETLAVYVNGARLASSVNDALARIPNRMNSNGQADEHGRISVSSKSFAYLDGNRMQIKLSGSYSVDYWWDPSWTYTLTDTLSLDGGGLARNAAHPNLDSGLVASIADGLFDLVNIFTVGSLRELFGDPFHVNGPSTPVTSPGAQVAQILDILSNLPLEGGTKFTLNFSRLQVNAPAATSGMNGIVAGGIGYIVPRVPSVTIWGIFDDAVTSDFDVVVPPYTAEADLIFASTSRDLRAPLSFSWTSDGLIQSPGTGTTRIRFPLGVTQIGQVLTKQVTVRVTDADGLTATKTRTVRITVRNMPPDPHPGGSPM